MIDKLIILVLALIVMIVGYYVLRAIGRGIVNGLSNFIVNTLLRLDRESEKQQLSKEYHDIQKERKKIKELKDKRNKEKAFDLDNFIVYAKEAFISLNKARLEGDTDYERAITTEDYYDRTHSVLATPLKVIQNPTIQDAKILKHESDAYKDRILVEIRVNSAKYTIQFTKNNDKTLSSTKTHKCSNCGSALDFTRGIKVVCSYCGTTNTMFSTDWLINNIT